MRKIAIATLTALAAISWDCVSHDVFAAELSVRCYARTSVGAMITAFRLSALPGHVPPYTGRTDPTVVRCIGVGTLIHAGANPR